MWYMIMEPYRGMFDPKADYQGTDEMLRKKKDCRATIDAAVEIPQISHRVFGKAQDSFHLIGSSDNSQDHTVYVVQVTLADQPKQFIYRINADVVPDEYLTVEELVYAELGARNIPTPKVFATHLRDAEFPYDFNVLEKVGTGTLEAHLVQHPSPDEEQHFARQAGAYLANVHQIPLPGFGYFGAVEARAGRLIGLNNSWSDFITIRFEENLAFLRDRQVFDQSLTARVRNAFAHHGTLFTLSEGVLLHGDFQNANILVDSQRREIVAAVDLSQAKVGDPSFDIGFYATYPEDKRLAAFLEGYRAVAGDTPDLTPRIAIYDLRINVAKAKLRYRYGVHHRIAAAIDGINADLRILHP